MKHIPRIHDGIEFRPAPDNMFDAIDEQGDARVRLSHQWCFIMTRLNGLRTRADVCAQYTNAFGKELSDDALQTVIDTFDRLGLLNTNPRALWTLRYLHDQGITYRTSSERRTEPRESGITRRTDALAASFYDRAIYLINQGHLEESMAILRTVAEARPQDMRLSALISHLGFLLAREEKPDLVLDRRIVEWDAFDRALSEMLQRGQCPRCSEQLVIELGGVNHCPFCQTSFTAYVLNETKNQRKS